MHHLLKHINQDKTFSEIAQPQHKEAVRGCSFLYTIAERSVAMSKAFLVDVSIF